MRSTASSSSGTRDDDDDDDRSGGSGSFMETAKTFASAAAGAAFVAWGISKMLSGNKDAQQQVRDNHGTQPPLRYSENIIHEGETQRSLWSPPPRGRYKMKTDGSCHPVSSNSNSNSNYNNLSPKMLSPTRYKMKTDGSCHPVSSNSNSNSNYNNLSPKMLSPTRYKMKTDGSCHPVNSNSNSNSNYNNLSQDGVVLRGPSGYGGVLRDHDGKWVLGFIGFIGEADCLTSELYGILKGLRLLDKLNRYGSILETDSQAAFEWIKDERNSDPKHNKSQIIDASSDIILECRQLAAKNNISVEHISKNANKCADKLAKIAVQEEEEYMEIKYPSEEFEYLVETYGNFNN